MTASVEQTSTLETNKPQQTLLPFWPEAKRGFPNVFARSALFRVSSFNKKRTWYEGDFLATLGEYTIKYTGHELRQDDADLYLQILHLARTKELGNVVEFRSTTMLKALKRSLNSVYKEKMIRSLTRMTATAIEVNGKNAGYTGSLIQSFSWKDDSGGSLPKLKVTLDPKIIALFGWDNYTQLEWEQRMSLTPLGKWLHYHYMSHRHPHPMKIKTIMETCGSQMSAVSDFKKELIDCMEDLVKTGAINSFEINKDLLSVKRFEPKSLSAVDENKIS